MVIESHLVHFSTVHYKQMCSHEVQKNMDSRLTDNAHLVKIVSNCITALNFSKKNVVLNT